MHVAISFGTKPALTHNLENHHETPLLCPPLSDLPPLSLALFVVFDAAKPLRAGERPAPVLEWATVPPAANRTQTYLDVINLSTKENLQADVAGSKIALPKRKRVRVSNKAAATVRILPDGPNISISAGEGGGASQMLALVFSKPDGSIDYAVASEPDVQR